MTALLRLDVEHLPSTILWDQPVSDGHLERLCAANDLLRLERTKEGVIRVNPPTGLLTSDGNSEITYQLRAWWKTHRKGRVMDSDGGFYLKDGSMLNPDGAYISAQRLESRPAGPETGFPHVCPDFVIELLSQSDRLPAAQRKMEDWIANGVLLGWLIDPYTRDVLIYVPDAEPIAVTGPSVEGTGRWPASPSTSRRSGVATNERTPVVRGDISRSVSMRRMRGMRHIDRETVHGS